MTDLPPVSAVPSVEVILRQMDPRQGWKVPVHFKATHGGQTVSMTYEVEITVAELLEVLARRL